MKAIRNTIIILAMAVFLPSCESWFNETSSSQIPEDDQFSTPAGFEQALIGCYMGMCEEPLYGKYLTWHMPEIIAQQFEPYTAGGSITSDRYLQAYNYTNSLTRPLVENIWLNGYNVIANANNAIKHIDQSGESVLPYLEYQLIKGELHAIRAFMHFGLLRWFGYGNWSARNAEMRAKLTLPYVTELSRQMSPQSTGADFIDALLADIKVAEEMLNDIDPILDNHEDSYYSEVNIDGFFNNRTKRLNYYAVQALKARVLMWEGSPESIRQAREIAETIFPLMLEKEAVTWMSQANVATNRILTTEAIFMLNVSDIESKTTRYIKSSLTSNDLASSAMYITADKANDLYETATVGSTDWRYTTLTTATVNNVRVPLKYYQDASTNRDYKNLVPLVRLPELLYIAAEAWITGPEQDLDRAMYLLNMVRGTRGVLSELSGLNAEELLDELTKEYRKEFLSEGVVFTYFKRRGFQTIPNILTEMGDAQYLLPYPEIDQTYGYVQ